MWPADRITKFVTGEEDPQVGICREEGSKESRQQPKARREGSRAETVGPKHIGTVGGCGIPPLGQS